MDRQMEKKYKRKGKKEGTTKDEERKKLLL